MKNQKDTWSEVAADRRQIMTASLLPLHTMLLATTRASAGESLLDAGCGSGELCALSLALGCNVTGVDIAPAMIELCRNEPSLTRAHFVEGDLQCLPFDTDSFDVAIASMSVHFCDDPLLALRELFRIVRPGGRFGISAPASLSTAAVLVFKVAADLAPEYAADSVRPLFFASPGFLAEKLTEVGFKGIEEQIARCVLKGPSFEELFEKQRTWAPIRRVVDAVGKEAFLARYQERLADAVGTATPTELDMSYKVVTATKP